VVRLDARAADKVRGRGASRSALRCCTPISATPRMCGRRRSRRGVLAPDRPVGLLSVAVLHFVPDSTGAREAIGTYRELLPPGSLYVLSGVSPSDVEDDEQQQLHQLEEVSKRSGTPGVLRARAELMAFFGDFAGRTRSGTGGTVAPGRPGGSGCRDHDRDQWRRPQTGVNADLGPVKPGGGPVPAPDGWHRPPTAGSGDVQSGRVQSTAVSAIVGAGRLR